MSDSFRMSVMYLSSMDGQSSAASSVRESSLLVVCVHASLRALTSKGDVGLLVDLGVQGVERLGHVVVEAAWQSVVLAGNRHYRADFLGIHDTLSSVPRAGGHNSRVVIDALLRGLAVVLRFLD